MNSFLEKSSMQQIDKEVSDKLEGEISKLGCPTPSQIVQPPRVSHSNIASLVKTVKEIPESVHRGEPISDPEMDGSVAKMIVSAAEVDKLSDKYKILVEYFDRLDTSIRLLSLQKKVPTFQNISVQVEIFTKRKFLHRHLAQMKYIFPEALLLQKIMAHDAISLCMKPDLKVTLLRDSVSAYEQFSSSMALCQVFRKRLMDFVMSHSLVDDIPEAVLPEPFNEPEYTLTHELLPETTIASLPVTVESESFFDSSHFSAHFYSQFDKRPLIQEGFLQSDGNNSPSRSVNEEISKNTECPIQEEVVSSLHAYNEPAKCHNSPVHVFSSSSSVSLSSMSTPMTATPRQQPPKRPTVSPSGSVNNDPNRLSRAATKRSLDFSLHEDDAVSSFSYVSEWVKARKNLSGNADRQKTLQFGKRQYEQILACLYSLFDHIQIIFRKANLAFITKQELLHKILSQSLDFIDSREVEEQLDLLEEFLPDLISKKIVSSGDEIYSIMKIAETSFVRARLTKVLNIQVGEEADADRPQNPV